MTEFVFDLSDSDERHRGFESSAMREQSDGGEFIEVST